MNIRLLSVVSTVFALALAPAVCHSAPFRAPARNGEGGGSSGSTGEWGLAGCIDRHARNEGKLMSECGLSAAAAGCIADLVVLESGTIEECLSR